MYANKVPGYLWIEAANSATYLRNRGLTRANGGITPEQKYTGRKIYASHLRTWGCLPYLHVPKSDREKLGSKTSRRLFVGYDLETKAYRVYLPDKRKITISPDVTFDESKLGLLHVQLLEPINESRLEFDFGNWTGVTHRASESSVSEEVEETSQELPYKDTQDISQEHIRTQLQEGNIPERPGNILCEQRSDTNRYSRRERMPSTRLRDYYSYLIETDNNKPTSYAEASQNRGWIAAVGMEIESIQKNHTWDYVELSERKDAITAKWVYRTKKDSSGNIQKLKARVVARGFEQVLGVDFYDTFAPVVRWSTIRTIVAVAASKK